MKVKRNINSKLAAPYPELVKRLLRAKAQRNISARDLAREAGVTQPTVTTLIADPARAISFHVASRLEGWVIAQAIVRRSRATQTT